MNASGAVGSPPTVDFPTPLRSDAVQSAVIETGDGEQIAAGQIVDFQVTLFDGVSGGLVAQSSYDDQQAPLRRVAGPGTDPLGESLQCAIVGSRIAVVGAAQEVFGADMLNPSLGVGNADPVVVIFDVQTAYLGRATGVPQLGASGIPAVVTSPDGIPGVTIPTEPPPSELRAHTLVLGAGDVIAEGDRAVLHYTGLLWREKTIFDSSWDRGAPVTFTIASFDDNPNGVVPGLAEGLTGKTIGSQVIVVIPPELGYPEGQSPATIPAGSTIVFVVDILGVEG